MAFLLLEDETGLFEAIIFPEVFQHYFSLMVKEGLLIIKGKMGDKSGEEKIIIQEIKNLYSYLPGRKQAIIMISKEGMPATWMLSKKTLLFIWI